MRNARDLEPVTMSAMPVGGEELAPTARAMPAPDSRRFLAPKPAFDPEGALEALTMPVCVISSGWRLLYMNRAFAELAIQGGEVALMRDLREIFTSLGAQSDGDLETLEADARREWRIQ